MVLADADVVDRLTELRCVVIDVIDLDHQTPDSLVHWLTRVTTDDQQS